MASWAIFRQTSQVASPPQPYEQKGRTSLEAATRRNKPVPPSYDRHKRPCGSKMLGIPATDTLPCFPAGLIPISTWMLRVRVVEAVNHPTPVATTLVRPAKGAGNLRVENTPRLDGACPFYLRHFSDADG